MNDTDVIPHQQRAASPPRSPVDIETEQDNDSDFQRAQQIITALSGIALRRRSDIRVEVDAGRVILRGRVQRYDDLAEAERLAKQVCPDCRVVNQLVITSPPEDVAHLDKELAQRVRETLRRLEPDGLTKVTVTVKDGVVTLQGVVTERAQHTLAEGLAVGVPGVKRLRNQILLVDQDSAENQRVTRCLQRALDEPPLRGVDLPLIKVSDGKIDIRGALPDPKVEARLQKSLEQALS